MKKHRKHSRLAAPNIGEFARNEWAILGGTCKRIQTLAQKIAAVLHPQFKLAYLDAAHEVADAENPNVVMDIEKQANHFRFVYNQEMSKYKLKTLLQEVDICLLNGNHFTASQHIVLLQSKRLERLEKKLANCNDIIAVVNEDVAVIPDFVKSKIKDAPIFSLEDTEGLAHYLQSSIKVSPVHALILNGGKSTRMGQDKSTIHYHGQSQLSHLYDLLSSRCAATYISVAQNQQDMDDTYPVISDSFVGLGAYSGILSAFQQNPNAAWLVVAIDMPNVNEKAIDYLLQNRNPAKFATAFLNPATQFPDPLLTIFEPKSYGSLLQYLALGYACPRKMLINEDVQVLSYTESDKLLLNINTPEEKNRFQNKRNAP